MNNQKSLKQKIAELETQLAANAEQSKCCSNVSPLQLETARKIQQGLLPSHLPEVKNITVASFYAPQGKVGGDFYDIIITPRQKTAFLIFDVSGGGIAAALIGATVKMLFAMVMEKTDSPAQVFRTVNQRLKHLIKTEHYVTAFLAVFDRVSNRITYSQAGHPCAYLYRKSSGNLLPLTTRGFMLGQGDLPASIEFGESFVVMQPKDLLFLYTDGLTDVFCPEGAMYGSGRLCNSLIKHGENEPEQIISKVLDDQARFRNGIALRDDLALLLMRLEYLDPLLIQSGFFPEDRPQLRIISIRDEIDEVVSDILREMDRCGFSDDLIRKTKVSLLEMTINAINHGNRNDISKKVYVTYKVTAEMLKISITDEGEGFDYTNLPDPLKESNRIKSHGRGLFLVKKYMDIVEFNSTGNRILAIKKKG